MIAWLAAAPPVRALALALLHFVWQGALLGVGLWGALGLAGRRAARLRYALSCGALAAAAAMPVITAIEVWPDSPPPLPLPAGEQGTSAAPLPWHAYAALVVVALWLAGAALRLARIGLGLHRIRRLLARCSPLRDEVAARARSLAASMGLSRPPRLLESGDIDVPMAVGWLRPAVLVPLSAITALPPAQLDALLAHEIAHVKRHDFLVNLLQEVVCAALFYHPAVHFIARSIREAREHAADDEAAERVPPGTLARALCSLESIRSPLPELTVGSSGGDLMNRIQRLLKSGSTAERRGALPALAVTGALLAAAAVGLGSCAGASETGAPITGAQAASEVHIRWLPPALAPYRALFEEAAQRHHVDADVIAIVALLESAGDPDAESPAGAVGLMQIMPATFARIARERGMSEVSPEKLRDPSVNVDFGAWYLAEQATAFAAEEGGAAQVALASAAYNAGPKAVRAFLAGEQALPEETARYQDMVVRMYEERDQERSATFDAWRERVRTRAAEKAASPLPGGRVTAVFGPESGLGDHRGVDLAAKTGTPILAPLDGAVSATEEDKKLGLVVVVRHTGGLETRYYHLGTVGVKAGDPVRRGDTIGTVGSSGVVTGPHVHYEVRDLGTPVDPAAFLPQN